MDIAVSGNWDVRVFFEATLRKAQWNWVQQASGRAPRCNATVDLNEENSVAYINRIDASPVAEGFGSELLSYIIAQVKDHGFKVVSCYIESNNAGSRSLFRKAGFTEENKHSAGSYWELHL
jgi:GNAT superfamily N-acetyltransferase